MKPMQMETVLTPGVAQMNSFQRACIYWKNTSAQSVAFGLVALLNSVREKLLVFTLLMVKQGVPIEKMLATRCIFCACNSIQCERTALVVAYAYINFISK